MTHAPHRSSRLLPATLLLAVVTAVSAGSEEKLNGYAEFREPLAVVVDGQVVRADKKTRFKKTDIRRVSSIRLGYEVKVEGRRLEDGSVLATKIYVHRNLDTSLDNDLKQGFDEIEKLYLSKGRMARTDQNGKLVEDYGKLLDRGHDIELVEADGWANTIFRQYRVPSWYSKDETDLLLKLPLSYRSGKPDMFWTDVDLTLHDGRVPNRADVIEVVCGRKWRRFSWHLTSWNPGSDDLGTYLEFVDSRFWKER